MKIGVEKDKKKVHLRNVRLGHIFKWTYHYCIFKATASEEATLLLVKMKRLLDCLDLLVGSLAATLVATSTLE